MFFQKKIFLLTLERVHTFFTNTVNFEKSFKSNTEEYFKAYTELHPDSWDKDLIELY